MNGKKFTDKQSGKIVRCPFCGTSDGLISVTRTYGFVPVTAQIKIVFYLCECGEFFRIHEGRIYSGRCSLQPTAELK